MLARHKRNAHGEQMSLLPLPYLSPMDCIPPSSVFCSLYLTMLSEPQNVTGKLQRWPCRSQIIGLHFESIGRRWTDRCASETTTGGRIDPPASAQAYDRSLRQSFELDVVALQHGPKHSSRCLAAVRPTAAGPGGIVIMLPAAPTYTWDHDSDDNTPEVPCLAFDEWDPYKAIQHPQGFDVQIGRGADADCSVDFGGQPQRN